MIDIVFYILMVFAFIQGWRKGLILGLFSLVCGIVGLAATVKLSAVVATHMKSDLHWDSRWLPVIAFILVFILVLLLIRWAGRLLENILRLVMLEWLNKLGGILLFILLYLSIYSIVLFYGVQSQIISKQAVDASNTYPWIAPFGPAVIRFITGFIPYGQDMFEALKDFFGGIARHID